MSILGDKAWHVHHGDCIAHMFEIPDASFDFSVFSPPFPQLYSYTSLPEDIGNSEDLRGECKLHLGFFYRELARVVKPGRVVLVHVAQIPRLKRSGGVGLHDFRGTNIRIAERSGLVYEYDWSVRKNPQSQAIRTKSRELQFSGLESDRAKSRGALPDFLVKFRVPGENAVPVRDWAQNLDDDGDAIGPRTSIHPCQVSRNEWIAWAEHHWHDIKETDTLNVREGRGEDDVKHICPLQIGVINRAVRLFTNPGDIVFSPFTGIGSEGYVSVKLGRRFYGCEIKKEYLLAAKKNIALAENSLTEGRLFV